MAEELDAKTLKTLAHAVPELGTLENLVSPAPEDVNGEEDSDHSVQGLNVNGSVPEAEVVTTGNVQNETGIDVKDIEFFHVGSVKGIEDFRDALMEMDTEVGYYPDSANNNTEEKHEYSVGDLVWGKIRSHPWWPGQIYDPNDASDDALKLNQKGHGRYLVAYYGDASFSWCLPSQLIPFAEDFQEMSEQSSSKTFVKAVQQAVDEISRLVELKMTCSCVPHENQKGLTRPLAVNAGIKSGVVVPDGDIGNKLLSFKYDPYKVLSTLSGMAQSVSFACPPLELSILKGRLSAFYCSRGGFMLPVYYEPPLFVLGLEKSVDVIPEGRKKVTSDIVNRKRKFNTSVLRKEEMQDRCLLKELIEDDIPIGEILSSIRPRRKSRYLSPPFTNIDNKVIELEKLDDFARVGERMKSVAEHLFESSPLGGMDSVGVMSKKIIEAVDAVGSDNEVLSGLVSGAKKRKEKSSGSKISTEEKSYTPKRKKTSLKEEEANCTGLLEKNASLTSSLFLTVPRGSSLPSKDDIMKAFSEYGHVNEEETFVFSNHCRVKILHENIAGVEAALRELIREKPLGSATVDYKICYSSAAPAPVASVSPAPVVAVGSELAAPMVVASDLASDGMTHLGSNGQT